MIFNLLHSCYLWVSRVEKSIIEFHYKYLQIGVRTFLFFDFGTKLKNKQNLFTFNFLTCHNIDIINKFWNVLPPHFRVLIELFNGVKQEAITFTLESVKSFETRKFTFWDIGRQKNFLFYLSLAPCFCLIATKSSHNNVYVFYFVGMQKNHLVAPSKKCE